MMWELDAPYCVPSSASQNPNGLYALKPHLRRPCEPLLANEALYVAVTNLDLPDLQQRDEENGLQRDYLKCYEASNQKPFSPSMIHVEVLMNSSIH